MGDHRRLLLKSVYDLTQQSKVDVLICIPLKDVKLNTIVFKKEVQSDPISFIDIKDELSSDIFEYCLVCNTLLLN